MNEDKSKDGLSLEAPSIGWTLKHGIRAIWDALGLVCAASLTLFAALSLPLSLLAAAVRAQGYKSLMTVCFSMALFLFIVPPLFGGICWLAHKVFARDEPSYVDLWKGYHRLFLSAVALGAIQLLVAAVLLANIAFYLSRSSLPLLLLSILFAYGLLFWWMNCIYHWPLLVANEAGEVCRDDGSRPGLFSVFRNGFLATVSAPGYTFVLTLFLAATMSLLTVSGLGLALLGGGLVAFFSTQATRDQLVRFGVLPAEPDLDADVIDEVWKLK